MPGRARRGNRLSMWLPRRFSRGCRYDADRPPRRRGPRLHGERAMIRRVTNRYRRLDPRGAALALVLGLGVALACPSAAYAQQICAADLNNNGDAADEGEQASCLATTSGAWLCPIQEVDCVADAMGQFSCPVGPQYACLVKNTGGTPSCSPNQCADLATNPVVEEPPMDDPGTVPDGGIDADDNCMGTIEIFSGRGVRCRPAGLSTTFSNCCKDKGKIVKDGMGSSIASIGTKIAVAKGVFTGMRAAYTAFKAGATASQAASSGANALIEIGRA